MTGDFNIEIFYLHHCTTKQFDDLLSLFDLEWLNNTLTRVTSTLWSAIDNIITKGCKGFCGYRWNFGLIWPKGCYPWLWTRVTAPGSTKNKGPKAQERCSPELLFGWTGLEFYPLLYFTRGKICIFQQLFVLSFECMMSHQKYNIRNINMIGLQRGF